MTKEILRKEFTKETGTAAVFANRIPYINYIEWLEYKLVKNCSIPNVVGRSEQLQQNFCTLNRETCGKGSGCKYPHCHL